MGIMTRDSIVWTLALIAAVATFMAGQFDLLERAFGFTDQTEARIEFVSGLAGMLAGFMRMSPLALSRDNTMAIQPDRMLQPHRTEPAAPDK